MGRRARDLALRCAASLWAKLVWEATGLDFDELDFVFIPSKGWNGAIEQPDHNPLILSSDLRARRWAAHKLMVLDRREALKVAAQLRREGKPLPKELDALIKARLTPRVMNRIYRAGESPERVVAAEGGTSNLVIVMATQDERCRPAREIYENPIWQVLAAGRPLSIEAMELRVRECLARLGLGILDENMMYVAELVIGDAFPIKENDLGQISDGAEQLASTGSLDAVLPLAFLCKLADEDLAFDIADIYVKALDRALFKFQEQIDDAYIVGTLRRLIHNRLLRNRWRKSVLSDWLRSNLVRGGNRDEAEAQRQEAQQMDNPALALLLKPEKPAMNAHMPVIVLDKKLTWFYRYHYVVLQAAIMVASRKNPFGEKAPADPQGEIDRVRRFWGVEDRPINLFKTTIEEAVAAGKARGDLVASPSSRLRRKKIKSAL